MKLTAHQTTSRTITDLCRAQDRRQPVTITYTKADGSETIRTIEIYDLRTTKAGDVIVKAMDRQSGESRTFRVDRIRSYTRHTGATYQVERPVADTPAVPAPATVSELIARELDRDEPRPAHYRPAA